MEIIPKKDKKQRGKATPLDMRVVNKVSMTDSNSILFSPRIEDLPVNPAKGKVQKSQQHFHRAYPSNSKLNKTDVKKYLNRKSIRGWPLIVNCTIYFYNLSHFYGIFVWDITITTTILIYAPILFVSQNHLLTISFSYLELVEMKWGRIVYIW